MGPKREKARQYLVCPHFVQNGPSDELPTQLFKSRLLQATKAPVSLCQVRMQADASVASVASAHQAVKENLDVRGIRVMAFSCPRSPPDNADMSMHVS
jgi:hypothetical protein